MKYNSSIPQVTVIPVLAYPDVHKAVEWLSGAFGFTERLQIGENHRSQLNVGNDGAVIICESRNDVICPQNNEVMIRVEDVNSHHNKARKYGVKIIDKPKDYMYGERQYTAEDLAGYRWTFTQSIKDVDPAKWGGILKDHPNK